VRRLIQLSVRLYPPAWRARYGAEFGDLLQDQDPSLAVLVDVVRRGSEARLRSWLSSGPRGGSSVFEGVQRRAGLLGVIGLLVVLPTTVLVAVAALKYIVGMAAPFDAIDPVLTPIVTHPSVKPSLCWRHTPHSCLLQCPSRGWPSGGGPDA